MHPPLSPTRSPHRLALLAASLLLLVVPTVTADPVGASPADLVTEDGLGIRVDETSLLDGIGDLETVLQPFVNDVLYDEATGPSTPYPTAIWVEIHTQVTLTLDFLVPGGIRPDGAVGLVADLADIELEFRMTPAWPFADCSIRLQPDDASHATVVAVDPPTPWAAPTNVPTWPGTPSVSTDGVCWSYGTAGVAAWWANLTNPANPTGAASLIGAEVDALLVDLLDAVWQENVLPVVDSLAGFAVDFDRIHTDDHGLIVTADVDATDLTVPPFWGPYDVSAATDSGVDSDINYLLAQRTTASNEDAHLIVSLHPNVTNQHMYALTDLVGGDFDRVTLSPTDGATVTEMLIPLAHRSLYDDSAWDVRLRVQAPPSAHPTGAGGGPQLDMPAVTLAFVNTGLHPTAPVATFTGTIGNLDLRTPGSPEPTPFSTANLSLSVTRTQANVHAAQVSPQGDSDIRPWAIQAVEHVDTHVFIDYVDLVPRGVPGTTITLCTDCGIYTGDERYTETFHVS